jgi:hypothetical protein
VQSGSHEHGTKAINLAERTGTKAMPWQRDSLLSILSKNPDGTWTHPDCCIICPRQNGKSLVLSFRVVYGIFVLNEQIVFTAQRWTTAEDLYKRTWAMIKSRPSLLRRVVRNTCSQGRGTIELDNGSQVVFTTRSGDAGRGLTKLDLVIYDEAYSLTDGEMSALSPAQLAAFDPQTIFTSSAVNLDLHPDGHVLAAIRRRGLANESELYFAEYQAPEEFDRESEEAWQYANPSYGVIQTSSKIRKLMRGFATRAGQKSFDVEILGRGDWPTDEIADQFKPAIDLEIWAASANGKPDLTDDFAIALDMSEDRSVCTIAAATLRSDKGVHVEVIYHGATGQAAELLRKIHRNQKPRAVVIARSSPGWSLEPELAQHSIITVGATDPQLAQACGAVSDGLDDGLFSHTGDIRLVTALESATKRNVGTGGAWAWDRRDAEDITAIVAITLARYGLWVEAEEPQRSSVYETEDLFIV